jgi:hypothetical protein
MAMMPGGGPTDADRLILEAATGVRLLTRDQLQRVLEHVAQAGFNLRATETARSDLSGLRWQGRVLTASARLRPDHRHFLKHVVVDQEWPIGTTLQGYVDSIRRVILDPSAGVFTNQYLGAASLGIVRESRELRGPDGHDWVLVQYRLGWGHWVTAFQPDKGLDEVLEPQWGNVRWLRRPNSNSEP